MHLNSNMLGGQHAHHIQTQQTAAAVQSQDFVLHAVAQNVDYAGTATATATATAPHTQAAIINTKQQHSSNANLVSGTNNPPTAHQGHIQMQSAVPRQSMDMVHPNLDNNVKLATLERSSSLEFHRPFVSQHGIDGLETAHLESARRDLGAMENAIRADLVNRGVAELPRNVDLPRANSMMDFQRLGGMDYSRAEKEEMKAMLAQIDAVNPLCLCSCVCFIFAR
jgi:hypothetical protein